jgi:hypothetical protein
LGVLFVTLVSVSVSAALLDPVTNFAKGTVNTTYDSTATSIVLSSGDGANFPSTFSYNVIWWNATDYPDPSDDPNKEIVRVSGRTSDTLTVTRAQEGTTASTKNTSGKTYLMVLGITKKVIDDIDLFFVGTNSTQTITNKTIDTANNTITVVEADISDLTHTTGTPEGTAILSTGEVGGTKFLREDGDNTCSWQLPSVNSATLALDNLAAVAVNTAIISDTDITDDFGTGDIRWKDVYAQGIRAGLTAFDTTTISARDVDGAAWTDFITVTSSNTPTCVIASDVTATTQTAADNSTKIATTAYADAAAGGGGANTALSNLAAVQINLSLTSDTDITDDLGTGDIRWKDLYASGAKSGLTAADTLILSARDVDGAAWTDFITLTSNNTPTCVIASAVTGTTQSASDNSTKLATTAYADAVSPTSIDTGTVDYSSRSITVDTGGTLDINLGTAAGDDFTVDTNTFVVNGTNGYVGLGTNSPNHQFSNNGGSFANLDAATGFYWTGGAASKYAAGYRTGSDPGWAMGIKIGITDPDDTDFYIHFLDDQGNVEGSISGKSGGGGVQLNDASDERLKENIVDTSKGLATINAIKVRDYNKKGLQTTVTGFIAQELKEVVPNAVHVPSDPSKMMSVATSELIPILIKAVQELDAKIKILEAKP